MIDPAPRVLFLTSAAFNRVTGGGVTFSNLFAGWPKDAIATVHNDPVPVTFEVCDRYFRLGDAELRRWGWLRHVSLGKSPAVPAPGAGGRARRGLVFRAARAIKNLIFGDNLPETVAITADLDRWVTAFRPQVLYSILGSNAMMELAELLRVRYRLPLVIHIMDDWVSVLYRGGLLSFLQRRRKEGLMQHLVDRAAARLAICDDMAQAYQKRYGQPFVAFQNTIDVKRWEAFARHDAKPGTPARVVYIGSILPFAQLQSLIDCCQAVQALKQHGMAIQLDVFSPGFLAEQYRHLLVAEDAVFLHETISDDTEFFKTLCNSDVLLLPVNFDPYTMEYIRYSMPTKVPAYLASGTPIMAYGPPQVAQMAYARSAGWGLTVCERGVDHVIEGLVRICGDLALRQQLSQRARQTACERHDVTTVRRDFQAALRAVTRAV